MQILAKLQASTVSEGQISNKIKQNLILKAALCL